MVVGDSRGYTNGIEQIILREIAKEIVTQGAEFVLFPGDLVYGYSAIGPSGFEAQLRTWVEIMKPVYDANISVFACRGNHEIGDVWSQNPYPDIDPFDNYATRWLNVFGSDDYPEQKLPGNGPPDEKFMTYSLMHKNAFVVSLDQYAGIRHRDIHKVNQKWLDAQLAVNIKPHIFIFGHEPAFRALHTDCLDNRPAERDVFWAGIRNSGGRTYFCGHDHFYDHARVDDGDADPTNDIHQYIIATAGASPYSWSPPYAGNNSGNIVVQWYHAEKFGYVVVEIDKFDVTMTWMERHTNELSAQGIYEPRDVWNYVITPRPMVLSPNGNESLVAGTTHTITWKTMEGAKIDSVMIEYSSDDGQKWRQICQCKNTGFYLWNPVPVVDSDRCLVRISDLNDVTIHDTSDNTFTMFQCLKQLDSDLNGDCYVDFLDLAILAGDWLKCGNPFDPSCE
ncbi:metallophosphoesterase family protein [Planctomycetota bacterium]